LKILCTSLGRLNTKRDNFVSFTSMALSGEEKSGGSGGGKSEKQSPSLKSQGRWLIIPHSPPVSSNESSCAVFDAGDFDTSPRNVSFENKMSVEAVLGVVLMILKVLERLVEWKACCHNCKVRSIQMSCDNGSRRN